MTHTAGIAYSIHLRTSRAPTYMLLTTGSHTSAKTSRYCTSSRRAKHPALTYPLEGEKYIYIIAVQQEYINVEIGVSFAVVSFNLDHHYYHYLDLTDFPDPIPRGLRYKQSV